MDVRSDDLPDGGELSKEATVVFSVILSYDLLQGVLHVLVILGIDVADAQFGVLKRCFVKQLKKLLVLITLKTSIFDKLV